MIPNRVVRRCVCTRQTCCVPYAQISCSALCVRCRCRIILLQVGRRGVARHTLLQTVLVHFLLTGAVTPSGPTDGVPHPTIPSIVPHQNLSDPLLHGRLTQNCISDKCTLQIFLLILSEILSLEICYQVSWSVARVYLGSQLVPHLLHRIARISPVLLSRTLFFHCHLFIYFSLMDL